jgi:C4-dicarboxylate-specific signal transduction histidine kinase
MKSAPALSAEIDLTQLMQKIMAVVLESSAAQHGYLLIKQNDELLVAAEQHVGKKRTIHKHYYSLNKVRGICHAIVNYVQRTHEKVVLSDAASEGDFQSAPEVAAFGLHSVLCLPVIKQSEFIGLLYLENRLSKGVFTPEKISMTELLTAQAAISLENARLLEQTRQAYKQLQENQDHMLQMEKLSALGTLVGGVAHEINNPLMGVMNFVEFVSDRTEDPKSKHVLGQALQQIQRIKNIVSSMLVFMHQKTAQTGSCSLEEVLDQTLLLLAGELRKHAIQLHTQIPVNLPNFACSAESMQQILINLLINARDALSGIVQPAIEISVSSAEKMLELSIKDNGPGIPESVQSRMFDPFFTTKPPGQGTGLGLSVTRRLLQDIGGSIVVESRVGEGCRLRLRFPRF